MSELFTGVKKCNKAGCVTHAKCSFRVDSNDCENGCSVYPKSYA